MRMGVLCNRLVYSCTIQVPVLGTVICRWFQGREKPRLQKRQSNARRLYRHPRLVESRTCCFRCMCRHRTCRVARQTCITEILRGVSISTSDGFSPDAMPRLAGRVSLGISLSFVSTFPFGLDELFSSTGCPRTTLHDQINLIGKNAGWWGWCCHLGHSTLRSFPWPHSEVR
jgi:hypothetical protein